MTNNKIINSIMFLTILIIIIGIEYFLLKYSFLKKMDEKKEIIQQIKLIEFSISPNELLLEEAQKKSEAEAEQRREQEAKRKSYLNGLIAGSIDKGAFPNDNYLLKLLFMGIKNAEKKWTMPVWNWSLTLSQLAIFFEGRLDSELLVLALSLRKFKLWCDRIPPIRITLALNI